MRRPGPQQTPGVSSALLGWLGFVLLVVAHFFVTPLVASAVRVDFLLIALLFAAVRMRPGFAALTGFLMGVALDAFAPSHFGAAALVLTVVGFGASWLRSAFFGDNVGLTGLFLVGGKFAFDLVYTLITGPLAGSTLLMSLLVWSPLSALATGVVGVLLLTLFRPLFRPTGG